MKSFLSNVAFCLVLALPAKAQRIVELPVSADACAIQFALTGDVAPSCAPPNQDLGVARRLPPAGFSAQAAPLEAEPEERGYFVRFSFNSSSLNPEYSEHLKRLAKVASSAQMEKTCIKLVGHTDSVGSHAFNRSLSSKRARMVAAFLASEGGISMDRITTEARGKSQPLPSVPGPHPLNRRVEILARHHDGKTCR